MGVHRMKPTKVDSWPQAMVIMIGIVTAGAVLVFLVNAGWSNEGIIAFVTLALGLFGGQYVQTRKSSQLAAQTDEQSATLATIAENTNGKTEKELDEIADRAALRVIEAYRRGGM